MCQARVSNTSILQECFRVLRESVLPECATRVSGKSVKQECLTRVSHKSAPQEYATRVSRKSVPHDCPRRVSSKSVLQEWFFMRSRLQFLKPILAAIIHEVTVMAGLVTVSCLFLLVPVNVLWGAKTMKRAQAPPKKQPKTNHYMHRHQKNKKHDFQELWNRSWVVARTVVLVRFGICAGLVNLVFLLVFVNVLCIYIYIQGLSPSKCIKTSILQCFRFTFNEQSLPHWVLLSKGSSQSKRLR